MQLSNEDFEKLRQLEESLWIAETRFNKKYMESVLSPAFIEFGRSGKTYRREETLSLSPQLINVLLPLKNFQARAITSDVVLITYISEVQNDKSGKSNRSSLWLRTVDGWQLQFHQGTPVVQ